VITMRLDVTAREQAVIEEMRASGRYATEADAVRTAIWAHATHLGIDVPVEAFAVGGRQPSLFEEAHS